jgi:DNA primase
MTLSDEFLEQIIQTNDIVNAFSSYASLKKAGRDFVCLCPFHTEKTASCHVYTDSQSFYCFGCSVGGSVITFTQLTENLDFLGAVRLLAERAGMAMPDDEGGKAELHKRARIYEMNKQAAKFFRDCLLTSSPGLEFLRNRGLSDNTIRKYGLGYAPDSWNALKYHMNALGYHDTELIEAFLLKSNEKGNVYDVFRNRVMFPVIDRTGKILAFSGRRIDDGKDYKYVNTSDTPVYRKGENVFSINFAKNSKRKYLILCEGNIDALMLNQAGFDNAVAILGTALTAAQARLLRFYCEEAVLAYDSDAAGEKATVKAINLLNSEGMSARVLQLGEAKDPDDYIKRFGADSFEALIEKSGSAISFEMDKLKKSVDINTPAGRAEYLKKGVDLLSQINNSLDRMVYVSDLARDCEVSSQEVQKFINNSRRYSLERNQRRELIQSSPNSRAGSARTPLQPAEKAEQGIISFLFHSPDKLGVILRRLSPGDFPTDFNRKLFETLVLRLNKRQSIGISSLGGEFSAREMGTIERIKIENADIPFDDRRLNDYIQVLVNHKSKNKETPENMTNIQAQEYINKINMQLKGKV